MAGVEEIGWVKLMLPYFCVVVTHMITARIIGTKAKRWFGWMRESLAAKVDAVVATVAPESASTKMKGSMFETFLVAYLLSVGITYLVEQRFPQNFTLGLTTAVTVYLGINSLSGMVTTAAQKKLGGGAPAIANNANFSATHKATCHRLFTQFNKALGYPPNHASLMSHFPSTYTAFV